MSLQMRSACERCGTAVAAAICSYECTFCAGCGRELEHVCPNCGGELVPRPRSASA